MNNDKKNASKKNSFSSKSNWDVKNKREEIKIKYNEKGDSIFIGIDWEKYQNNIKI